MLRQPPAAGLLPVSRLRPALATLKAWAHCRPVQAADPTLQVRLHSKNSSSAVELTVQRQPACD